MSIRTILSRSGPYSVPSFCKRTGLPLSERGVPLLFPFQSTEGEDRQARVLVSKCFEKILKDVELPFLDPDSREISRQGFFLKAHESIRKHSDLAKAYIDRDTVQGVFEFLYGYLLNEHYKNPGCLRTVQIIEEFLDRTSHPYFHQVLSRVDGLNLLIDLEDDPEKLEKIVEELQAFVTLYRDFLPSQVLQDLFATKFHDSDGVSTISFLHQADLGSNIAFPITKQVGEDFLFSQKNPEIFNQFLRGRVTYPSCNNTSTISLMAARCFGSLLKYPYLTMDSLSESKLVADIEALNTKESRVCREISSAVRESRAYYPGCIHPCNEIAKGSYPLSLAFQKVSCGVSGLIEGEGQLPLIPEFLQNHDINARASDFDPGEFRAQNLLISFEEFLSNHTDGGYLYHGTAQALNVLSILRNGFVVSSEKQGAAMLGRGVYTSKKLGVSMKYTRTHDENPLQVLLLKVKTSPKLRILDLRQNKISQSVMDQWKKEADELNLDLFELLSEKYSIDIIVPNDPRTCVLLQNTGCVEFPSTIAEMYKVFLNHMYLKLQNSLKDQNVSEVALDDNSLFYRAKVFLKLFSNVQKIATELDLSNLTSMASIVHRYFDRQVLAGQVHCLEFASDTIKDNKNVVMSVVSRDGRLLEFASQRLRLDKDIVLAAVRNNGFALEFADPLLKNDRETVLVAVKQNNYALKYAGDKMKKNKEVVLLAVCNNGLVLEYADISLREDKEIVLTAVQNDSKFFSSALAFAGSALRQAKEVVIAAVKSSGGALEFAAEVLKNDWDVVLEAVKQDGLALEFAAKSLRENRSVVLAAVRQNGLALKFVSDDFKKDKEIVLTAVKQNQDAMKILESDAW